MTPRRHSNHDAALWIVTTLRAAGHKALFAGGCVRDMLLNIDPKDHDVATDATPEIVRRLFPRTRQVGAQFGVMLVRKFGHDIEVATFRTEGAYSDGRRPDSVAFTDEREDSRRRDFTINGLFYDPIDRRVTDYVGGQTDLAARVIRAIGDAGDRFAEDHLRMLRAVRFASRLNFAIEPATMGAIQRHAHKLVAISAERIWMELEMIITAPTRAVGWSLILESGLRPHLAEPWKQDGDADRLPLAVLAGLPPHRIDGALALAALLHAQTPETTSAIGRALRLSNELRKQTAWLLRSRPRLDEPDALELADLKQLMSAKMWHSLLALQRATIQAQRSDPAPLHRIEQRAADIAPEDVAPPPLLTGDDLTALGLPPGPVFGEILTAVYRDQLNERIRSRDEAMAAAKAMAT